MRSLIAPHWPQFWRDHVGRCGLRALASGSCVYADDLVSGTRRDLL